jgi:hypothetical protein
MDTQVRTPQMVFMQPQRLVVPLFQRPYVWNETNQWDPLWSDLVRVADRLLGQPTAKHHPHFLGAVVLQQVQNPTGLMQERTIIDGQQRLTTLQLLLDALHGELVVAGATTPALRIEPLVINAEPFQKRPEDRFKVWPTNRDRPAFNAVMGAALPVDYGVVGHAGERMVEAHRFFSEEARRWLMLDGLDHVSARGTAIEMVARDLVQMVVIDLAVDENAQEIFETLNARGAQLTAADLIKNFVFQRLMESDADVERAYERYWKDFEAAFWETEVSVGRVRYPRSSIFLNHWLIARTGEEIVAREVFTRFKTYADFDAGLPMAELLQKVDRAARVYRSFVEAGAVADDTISRLGLFGYRTGVLESEVIKPLVLHLMDPEEPPVPSGQLDKALDAIESWMVRRMLVRATTKNYNVLVAELITQLRKTDRGIAGDSVEAFFAGQKTVSGYWPDDSEIREELRGLLVYRRLRRGRLRMVLEAIEDWKRGWRGGQPSIGAVRVARGKYAIEHVMPVRWLTYWPLPEGSVDEADRDRLIHTIGNLTLLMGRLNTKVSNAAWIGPSGKRQGLKAHDVLFLNRDLLEAAGDAWTDATIRARTDELSSAIIDIWPAPEGHQSGFAHETPRPRHKVDLADLVSASWLSPGASLFPRSKKFSGLVATLLPDGRVDLAGSVYSTPSEAAGHVTDRPTNGWWFFLVDQASKRSLRDVRREYLDSLSVEEDETDDEGDDDDA